MNATAVREKLIEFLNSVVRPGQDVRSVSDETNLVDAGVIDSLALIQIIHYLETRHDLYLHDLGIDPSDLVSVSGILDAIRSAGA